MGFILSPDELMHYKKLRGFFIHLHWMTHFRTDLFNLFHLHNKKEENTCNRNNLVIFGGP